jgi:hypothetical protein
MVTVVKSIHLVTNFTIVIKVKNFPMFTDFAIVTKVKTIPMVAVVRQMRQKIFRSADSF